MVKINGEKLNIAGKTVAEYLATTSYDPKRIAVERHGEVLQKNFSEAVVAVCGLGGLGSNIAIALARTGVGCLKLTDASCAVGVRTLLRFVNPLMFVSKYDISESVSPPRT